jgi:hypothetical protein
VRDVHLIQPFQPQNISQKLALCLSNTSPICITILAPSLFNALIQLIEIRIENKHNTKTYPFYTIRCLSVFLIHVELAIALSVISWIVSGVILLISALVYDLSFRLYTTLSFLSSLFGFFSFLLSPFTFLFGELEGGKALLLLDFTMSEITKIPNITRPQRYSADLEIFLSILLEIFPSIFLEIFTRNQSKSKHNSNDNGQYVAFIYFIDLFYCLTYT